MKTAYDIIIRPVITEQSMEATDQKKYVFIVANDANKIEIKKAVSEIFGVKVEKVTTLRMDGKVKRQGRYPEGRTAESYRIPEGTIRVGGNAFAGNLFLKSVSYPTTLERIGTKAFFGCENLKDYYFNGMTAPLLETTVSLTGAYANVALYANFVGLWGTTGTGGFVYNDWGLNLYYPQGAVGYTAYVWDKYFNTEKGSVNIMDESYFTPTDLTVTETGVRNALLTWTAAKQSNAEDIVYKVERSVAAHFQDDTQDTWTFEGFETLAEGLTACTYTDTTTLPFGRSYAYRVTAYSLTGETGPDHAKKFTVCVWRNGEKLAEQEGEHIFRFRVKLDGEVKVQAVAGDCIDEASFRKVSTPNPAYKLGKKKSTSANWV